MFLTFPKKTHWNGSFVPTKTFAHPKKIFDLFGLNHQIVQQTGIGNNPRPLLNQRI